MINPTKRPFAQGIRRVHHSLGADGDSFRCACGGVFSGTDVLESRMLLADHIRDSEDTWKDRRGFLYEE